MHLDFGIQWVRLTVLSFLLSFLLLACGELQGLDSTAPDPTSSPLSAQLEIVITGLPADVTGDVTVRGPETFEALVGTSVTLENLQVGEYVVTVGVVQSFGPETMTYTPATAKISVTLLDNKTAPVRVEYMGNQPAVRLGLHFTEQELAIWRERAKSGPYRVQNDVSEYSPGDWGRIVTNAKAFLSDPSIGHWRGQTVDSCMTWGMNGPTSDVGQPIRDAAFYYLITEDEVYRDAVKKELLSLAAEPGTDLGNTRRWCQGEIRDSGPPGVDVANWFTTLLFSYDYLGVASFSAEENATLADWFLTAAAFLEREVALSLNRNFINRPERDYRISEFGRDMNANCTRITHYGGWTVCSLAAHYNNRRAASARFYGLAGIKFDDQLLKERAKMFVEEWLMFSVYPDGVMGEFERWRGDHPDLGWAYASVMLGSIHTLADAFARAGDTDLFDIATSKGAFGTEGGTKSIYLAAKNVAGYIDGTIVRYGTDRSDRAGRTEYLIDGVVESQRWYDVRDVLLAQANLYYLDDQITSVYTRTGDGTRPYPRATENFWSGEWFIYPGVLFMWGQLEGVANPFEQ